MSVLKLAIGVIGLFSTTGAAMVAAKYSNIEADAACVRCSSVIQPNGNITYGCSRDVRDTPYGAVSCRVILSGTGAVGCELAGYGSCSG